MTSTSQAAHASPTRRRRCTRSLADAADGSRPIAETVAHAAGRTNESAERTAGAASSVTEVSDRLRDQLGAPTH